MFVTVLPSKTVLDSGYFRISTTLSYALLTSYILKGTFLLRVEDVTPVSFSHSSENNQKVNVLMAGVSILTKQHKFCITFPSQTNHFCPA